VLITHKLEEIQKVADRCTVLRKGAYVDTVDVKDTTSEELAEMMVGRKVLFEIEKTKAKPKETVLAVENLHIQNPVLKADVVKNISFEAKRGEILCIAGIEGNGQTELVYGLVGLQPLSQGRIVLNGADISDYTIRQRSVSGVSHIPEDRQRHGLILDFTLENNLILNSYTNKEFQKRGFFRFDAIRKHAEKLIDQYDIRTSHGPDSLARSMSGGNQQKAILGREIDRGCDLLIAVQPTRGLDVGAIEYIHKQLIAERDRGKAVLLVSLDLDEVMDLSDRILVMYEGEAVGEFDPEKVTEHELGLYMSGSKRNGVA